MSIAFGKVVAYIRQNPVMVLGTLSAEGVPHGAAVYVYAHSDSQLFFITKSDTEKYQNILKSPKVSVTFFNTSDNSTLQAEGEAETIDDYGLVGLVMQKMAEVYAHSVDWLPPIAKISAGPYKVVSVQLSHVRLAKFKGELAGSRNIFSETTL